MCRPRRAVGVHAVARLGRLHSPALLFERTTRSADGAVIEYTRAIYRGDRYRITTRLTFPDA